MAITRIRVQNYRAILNVDLKLGSKQLLLGVNGAGKTSLLDAMDAVRKLVVEGDKCYDEEHPERSVFPLADVPRWLRDENKPQVFQQRVELDLAGEEGTLRYVLVVEQNENLARSRVLSEELTCDDGTLFSSYEGKVQLYDDRGSSPTQGPQYTFDWNRSAVGSVLAGPANRRLTWFRERLRSVHCVRIDAPRMSARSEGESARLERDCSNFASWYRRALVENTAAGADFLAAVRDTIGGLESLDLKDLGQGIMVLQAAFAKPVGDAAKTATRPGKTFRLEFSELSDGQRALIGLYALLHFMLRENTTLWIDEPVSFVALAEIQPWLLSLQDRVDDIGAQVLIASHHPEVLNLLAPDYGILLERDEAGPTRARPYPSGPEEDLVPSEKIARGWEA